MLERMRIFWLPSKPVKKLKELPQDAGVYYITALWIVLYVGKAKNLRTIAGKLTTIAINNLSYYTHLEDYITRF
jgi:hypothetical protein